MNKQKTNSKPSFSKNCYNLLLKIPKGRVTTYAEIAHALKTKAYRAVGNAMSKNPDAPRVPCHRVVASDGSLGGYAFGIKKKIELLKKEGIKFSRGRIVDLNTVMYKFKR